MWGKYIRDEWKYDKFGAQGKFMLLGEILLENGITLQPAMQHQKLINRVFPRTFYCLHERAITGPLAGTVMKYYRLLEREFGEQALSASVVERICLSETAEKFCLHEEAVAGIASRSPGTADAARL